MSTIIEKARNWWKADAPRDLGIAHVPLDTVEAAPAPQADEAKKVQVGFIQSLMSMERTHAATMTALSNATVNQVRG